MNPPLRRFTQALVCLLLSVSPVLAAAAELLDAIPDHVRDNVRPIVILISSDPDLTRHDIEANVPAVTSGRTWMNEIFAPLVGLYAARTGRGILAAQALRRKTTTSDPKGEFLHFRMCEENGIKPGLGWSLSPASEKAIQDDFLSECDNGAEFKRLETLLGGKSAGAGSVATQQPSIRLSGLTKPEP